MRQCARSSRETGPDGSGQPVPSHLHACQERLLNVARPGVVLLAVSNLRSRRWPDYGRRSITEGNGRGRERAVAAPGIGAVVARRGKFAVARRGYDGRMRSNNGPGQDRRARLLSAYRRQLETPPGCRVPPHSCRQFPRGAVGSCWIAYGRPTLAARRFALSQPSP